MYAVGALVVVLLVVGGWLVFTGPEEERGAIAHPGEITVGAMYPHDANNKESDDILKGERFAVEYINSRDDLKLPAPALPGGAGLLGMTLKLAHRASNDRCHAEATFDKLVDRDNAVAVLGSYESTITLRAILAADRRRVPLVNETSSAPSLTERPPNPGRRLRGCGEPRTDPRPSEWFFRVGASDRDTVERFLSLFAANRAPTDREPKVAILHESNDLFGNGAGRVAETLAKKAGMTARRFKYHTVIGSHGKSPCTRLETLIDQIATYQPDVLFAASYLPDAIAVVQTMKQHHNYTPPALLAFGSGFLNKAFIPDVAKPSALCPGLPTANPAGIVSRAIWSRRIAMATPSVQPIVKAYEKRYGPMNSRSAAGFTAMMTLAQAISDAGVAQPDRIRDALRRLDLPAAATIMPWGVQFDANGHNTQARVVLQQVIGGAYVDVYPDELAERSVIWPLALARR